MSAGPGLARIATVLRKELVESARDRRTIVVSLLTATLAGPLLLLLLFNLLAREADRAFTLTLPVRGATAAPALVQFLERQQVTIVEAPADYEARIRSGELAAVLVIDSSFEAEVAAGRQGRVQLVFDRSRDRARVPIEQAEALLRAYSADWGRSRLLLRGIAPEVGAPLNVEAVNLATPQQSGALVLFLVAYYGLLSAVVGTVAMALDMTAGERERASLEPLLVTPASPLELVTGKWLAATLFNLGIVLVTLGGFWVTLAFAPLPPVGVPFLFGVREYLRFLAVLLPVIALVPAVLLWLGSRGRTTREAQANVSVLMFVVALLPALQLFLQRREPDWLVAVPVSGQYAMMNRVLRGEGIVAADYALSWVVPLLLTALALAGVARLWSRESYLAGKS